MKFRLAFFCALALAGANAMACYTVFDRQDRVIYQGVEPPVDMSLPIHQTLGPRFPGAHMIFDLSTRCTPVALAQVARPSGPDAAPGTIRMERSNRVVSPNSAAPLLTDLTTAERSHLPHTQVAANIAVVPAQVAARLDLPTFTVIPSENTLARSPDTTQLGAGAASQQRSNTVITEMRDGSTSTTQRPVYRK